LKTICGICPRKCALEEGQTGFCNGRHNVGGKIVCKNYGQLTAIALDPIEKKPLRRFFPGSWILSVGSYGCNFRCPFCQNHTISMAKEGEHDTVYVSPEVLVEKALQLVPRGNIGIAYTYNEPLISYEYIMDCAMLAREKGLKNVIVSNGYICEEPLLKLLPCIDAANIDLKSFSHDFYKKIGGDLEAVKNTIAICSKNCHTEVTTLIIPDENDSPEEMEELSKWIGQVDKNIPLHITRFYPMYRYVHKKPADSGRIHRLAQIARKHLNFVYA